MKTRGLKPSHASSTPWVCGRLTKSVAAELILSGHPHIHSTILGTRDPGLKVTLTAIESTTIPKYSWELEKLSEIKTLNSSTERSATIAAIVRQLGITEKRNLKERTETVLEELLTNAIYHAYREAGGMDKYARNRSAALKPHEGIKIEFAPSKTGIFLRVTDSGGNLSLQMIGKSLARCYSKASPQIQTKLSGAGLGFYLIFEAATHIKVSVLSGVSTSVSCWISTKGNFDSHNFSFNYFLDRGDK